MTNKRAIIAPFGPQSGGMVELAKVLAAMFEESGAHITKVDKSTQGKSFLSVCAIYLEMLKAAMTSSTLILISSSGKSLWAIDLICVILGRTFGRLVIIDFVGGAAMEGAASWGILKNLALKWASAVVMPTSKMMESMKRQGVDANYFVIAHTVDVDLFKRARPHSAAERKVVLSAKNLEDYANVGDIIECMTVVVQAVPGVELWIAGSGPEEQKLRELASKLLPGSSVFLGSVSHDKMPEVMAETDILVHATRYESFGILLVEAMAAGIPLVSYNVGGISDVVKDGETGFLVKYGDKETMAAKLIYLLRNENARRNMGSKGMEDCRLYTKGAILARWHQLFCTLKKEAD